MNSNENTYIALEPTDKKQFIENIQQWVLIDKQLKIIHEKTNALRKKKQDINDSICQYIKGHQLSQHTFGLHEEEIRMYEKKDYSPLTFGYIEKTLSEIIPNRSNVNVIMNNLKSHRQLQISHEIRRKIKSQSLVEIIE
jgi:translation initiation factor RLI1